MEVAVDSNILVFLADPQSLFHADSESATKKLLQDGDMAATDAMAGLKQRCDAQLGEQMQPMCDAVARLEFDRALGMCKGLIEGQTT